MGTLTNRIQRHDRYWVRKPPNSAPAAPPPAATALHTPKALARARCSGKVTVRMVRVAGESTAAPTPWSDRAAIRVAWLLAKPPSRLAPVNRTSPTRKMRRRPNRSASRPPSSRRPPKVERVGGDHPLEVGRAEAQVLLDGRQGDVDDGDVEHDHELGQADDPQDQVVALLQPRPLGRVQVPGRGPAVHGRSIGPVVRAPRRASAGPGGVDPLDQKLRHPARAQRVPLV